MRLKPKKVPFENAKDEKGPILLAVTPASHW